MKALAGALLRTLGSFLEAADVARLRCACHALHAALAHDGLWRRLYACTWGPATEGDGSPLAQGQAELSWCERFAGRAAQRERWRRGVCERTDLPRAGRPCQFRTLVHEETLFVTTGLAEVLVFALPDLRPIGTWMPCARDERTLSLWLCGSGPTARLVAFPSGGPIRCWSPRTIVSSCPDAASRSQPQHELELASACAPGLCCHGPFDRCPVHWLWGVFFDDRHFTALGICARTVLEWSRETGCCLRYWSFPEIQNVPVYTAQYDGHHFFVGDARLRLHPTDGADAPLDSSGLLWSYTPLRDFVQRSRQHSTPVAPAVASFVFPDIARPRATPLTTAQWAQLSAQLHALSSDRWVYDLAITERFLVILWQDEHLTVYDYGLALPPRPSSAILPPQTLCSSP